MSKTTTNQNETQTETQDMLKEDQEFQETENIDEAEKGSEEVSASAEATEEGDYLSLIHISEPTRLV